MNLIAVTSHDNYYSQFIALLVNWQSTDRRNKKDKGRKIKQNNE
jgi:hypothetical protein